MFQVEADRKWKWAEIAKGLSLLALAWFKFFLWRLATLPTETFKSCRLRASFRPTGKSRRQPP